MSRLTPLVSVIVPVHNVQDYVASCIASLRIQTLADFEVIVVDDGSTDDSFKVAQEAIEEDPRFRLIQQENRGLSGARNAGLELAQGSFIAFVDSDDRVTPGFLFRLWQALETSGADWVACGIRFAFPDGTSVCHSGIHGSAEALNSGDQSFFKLANWGDVIKHFPSAWNKLYRRNLIDGLRFTEGTWYEDHAFFQQTAARTDHLLCLDAPLYVQTRGRAGQITGTDDDRVFEQFDVLEQIRSILNDHAHTGGAQAFQKLASRLMFERSTILRDPHRRARFATACAAYLEEHNFEYSPDWDPDISLAWGMEIAGQVPLSVVIPWSGQHHELLSASLASLNPQGPVGREILIVCDNATAARNARELAQNHPNARVLKQQGKGVGPARNAGLKAAKGVFIFFLDAGDRLKNHALRDWVNSLIRSDGDFVISAYKLGAEDGNLKSPFLMDAPSTVSDLSPTSLTFSPHDALNLDPRISSKLFRRSFLVENAIRFGTGCLPEWQVTLKSALLSEKIIYFAEPGCRVNDAPNALGQTRRRWSAGQLYRSLDRLEVALGYPQKAGLPSGWKRRLFGRAIQSQLSKSTPRRGKVGRAFLLASAGLAASWRGMAQHRTELDPFTNEGLEQILSVPAIILGKPAPAVPAPPAPNTPVLGGRQASIDMPMLPFRVSGQARFRFCADFELAPHANISFFDDRQADILFHLSLRQGRGMCVCNKRLKSVWVREIKRKYALPKGKVDVEITFDASNVTVTLDGIQVFRFGGFGLRRHFSNLNKIAFMSYKGAISTAQFDDSFHSNSPQTIDRLHLNNRIELQSRLRSSDTDPQFTLQVPGVDPLPRVVTFRDTQTMGAASPDDNKINVLAILPGRVWNAVKPNAPLEIELRVEGGGAACPKLMLTRADLAAKIESILSKTDCRTDGLLAMQILEHVRFAGLFENLPPETRTVLGAVQSYFGLGNYLLADDTAPKTPRNLPAPRPDPIVDCQIRFGRELRQNPNADALRLLRKLPTDLPEQLRHHLYLSMCEFFLGENQDFKAFQDHATKTGLAGDLNLSPTNARRRSALLPVLFLEGRYKSVATNLISIQDQDFQWIMTPAIAWIMRAILSDADLKELERDEILEASLALLTHLAEDYWGPAHCGSLIKATAGLVLGTEIFGASKQGQIIDTALQVYGLSKLFWQTLDDIRNDRPLPAKLAQAKEAFAVISASSETGQSGQNLDQALKLLQAIGCVETLRFRRELVGPAGLLQEEIDAFDLGSLALAGIDAKETVIRHMAFPGSAPANEEMVELAAKSLPEFYGKVERAPYYDLQIEVSRRIQDLLAQAKNQPVTAAELETLSPQLRTLSDPQSHFLGLGLILSLVRGLLSFDGHDDTVATLLKLAEESVHSLDGQGRKALSSATTPRLALMALRGTPNAEMVFKQAASILADCGLDLPDCAPLPTDAPALSCSPLFDTVVTVFSCRANLNTRVVALRDGWLTLLKALGIPYLIVVGDGDGQLDGDIVHLDAPDDYEGLPQKTLATIRWVHDNTRFSHMLKIDDDCFLNADLFFQALSYRKFDYFGRVLAHKPGKVNRAWHCGKSVSDRGKLELDKSPEPSTYTDGGSGYTLSRTAMAAILSALESPQGRYLVQLSFLEDKLIGDLLTTQGFEPENEDYRTSILRRTWSGGRPVSMWLNSFFASRAALVSLVHLDDHASQATAFETLSRPVLAPKKIWPSYQDAALIHQSNALELISSLDRLDAARSASVSVVSCLRNEMFMLPHFLEHYRKLGVESFLIADNCSDDGSLEYLIDQADVTLFSVDTDYRLSKYGLAWQQAFLSSFRVGKWSLVADIDELLVWQEKQTQTLPHLLSQPEFQNIDAARIFMLDMYPKGPLSDANLKTGPFSEAGFVDREPFLEDSLSRGPFSNMPTWTSALRHRLIPGSRPELFVAQKIALLKYQPWMHLGPGLHYLSDVQLSSQELFFAHFKYNAEFHGKAQTEVARRQHYNDAEEYHKYLMLLSEGRDVVYESGRSVPWSEAPFVKARLAP